MNKNKQTKNMELILWVKYSWIWDVPQSVVAIPSDTPLEKTDFPFATGSNLKQFLVQYDPMVSMFDVCLFAELLRDKEREGNGWE